MYIWRSCGEIYISNIYALISELGMEHTYIEADLVSCWGGYAILCLRKPSSDVTLSILPPAFIHLLLSGIVLLLI